MSANYLFNRNEPIVNLNRGKNYGKSRKYYRFDRDRR